MSDNPDSISELIHKNYSGLGAAVIQRLYGKGYLSPGGKDATERLARLAAPKKDTRILDVGCGVGGAAVWLAVEVGCSVIGLDLVASNIETAKATAVSHGVDRLVRFEQGDAAAMPFETHAFSMIWGQDAWCHVPDRDALFAECARVLEPGGAIVFSDWLLTGEEDNFYRQHLLPATACPGYETMKSYTGLLERHGFVDIEAEDLSADYASHYEQAMERLEDARDWIIETYGPRVFAIVREKNGCARTAFDNRQIGGGQFRARQPEPV